MKPRLFLLAVALQLGCHSRPGASYEEQLRAALVRHHSEVAVIECYDVGGCDGGTGFCHMYNGEHFQEWTCGAKTCSPYHPEEWK